MFVHWVKTCITKFNHYSYFYRQNVLSNVLSSLQSCCVGRGRPTDAALYNNQCGKPPADSIMSTADLLFAYHNEGGDITEVSLFGSDPIQSQVVRETRTREFEFDFLYSFEDVFSDIANGNAESLKRAIYLFRNATKNLMT